MNTRVRVRVRVCVRVRARARARAISDLSYEEDKHDIPRTLSGLNHLLLHPTPHLIKASILNL